MLTRVYLFLVLGEYQTRSAVIRMSENKTFLKTEKCDPVSIMCFAEM